MTDQKIHHLYIKKMNIGNHLFAYFFAKQLAKSLAGIVRIHFCGIPELAVPSLGAPGRISVFNTAVAKTLHYGIVSQQPDIDDIVAQSHRFDLSIHINWPVCRLPLIIPAEEARLEVAGCSSSIQAAKVICGGIATDHLMVNVRAGDILRRIHRDYAPTPVEYIKQAQAMSGLPVAFFGQTEPSWYTDRLRESFPDAKFIDKQTASIDFEIARQSKNILISASTFAWIATWISESAEKIYIPLHGFLDPDRRPDKDLRVHNDPRRIHIRKDIPDSDWYPF